MSDINTYADEAAITALSPINGDLVLNQADSSLYLCINADASGINRWKKFANDAALALFENRWGASFDGSNDTVNASLSSQVFNGDFTISSWIKPTRSGSNTILFHLGSSSSYDDGFRIYQQNGGFTFWNGLGATYTNVFNTVGSESLNNWQNLILTRSGSAMTFYIDGSSVGTGTNSAAYTNTDLTIAYPAYTRFKGLMDEIALFNTALSADDITKIYNGGKPTRLTSASSYDTDRTSNLKGYWRMGDDSNDTASANGSIAIITDSSGSGNDATQTDTTKQPTFKALDSSTTSLSFNSHYLDCGGASDFSFTNGSGTDSAFSISAWVKFNSFDRARVISKDSGTGNREYLFGTNGNRKFNMILGTGSVNLDIQNNTTLNTTDWFHVAATYDGSKSESGLKVYVNGDGSSILSNSLGTYSGMASTAGSLEIGRFGNGHSHFNGVMDDVAVFNSELSQANVSSLAASRGAHIKDDLSLSPVAYYRMGEDDSLTDGAPASQITDASGNGNHATQTGTTEQPTASIEPVIYV